MQGPTAPPAIPFPLWSTVLNSVSSTPGNGTFSSGIKNTSARGNIGKRHHLLLETWQVKLQLVAVSSVLMVVYLMSTVSVRMAILHQLLETWQVKLQLAAKLQVVVNSVLMVVYLMSMDYVLMVIHLHQLPALQM
jgi:hypothetical protein